MNDANAPKAKGDVVVTFSFSAREEADGGRSNCGGDVGMSRGGAKLSNLTLVPVVSGGELRVGRLLLPRLELQCGAKKTTNQRQ